MTEAEYIVQEAKKKEFRQTFELMKDTLVSIRDDARDYVEEFKEKYCVPKYIVIDKATYSYSYEPHVEYDFAFRISHTFEYKFITHIKLLTNGDVRYMVCVKMIMNDDDEDPLSGTVFIHFGSVEDYVNSIKQACNTCYEKYVELHKNLKNRFF